MPVQTREKQVYSEADIQKAISAIKNNEYRSIHKAALAFNFPNAALQGCISGCELHTTAHETQQVLSAAKEKTLSQWDTRLTHTGFPALPALAIEMAEEIRHGCVQLSRASFTGYIGSRCSVHVWLQSDQIRTIYVLSHNPGVHVITRM